MSKYYRTKEFKRLRKEWYKALRGEGFRDIEIERRYGKLSRPNKTELEARALKIKIYAAIDIYINNPIYTVFLNLKEYSFLDLYRFNGYSNRTCDILGYSHIVGKEVLRKYRSKLLRNLKYEGQQEDNEKTYI